MTGWCVIDLRVAPVLEDAAAAILQDLGCAGWESRPGGDGGIRILAYWRAPRPGIADDLRARLAPAAARLDAPPPGIAAPEPVPDEDWEAAWRRHFTTERPLPGLVVRPSWIAYDPAPGEEVLVIDPKMAFGVGSHATTRLSLRFLREASAGARVLDVGTGTGILAIAAARWGAREVMAVDTDPVAVGNAEENVRQNGVSDRVRVARGSAEEAPGTFDVVVANLLSSELAPVLPSLPARLSPGGVLIVSGFLRDELGAIRALLESHGFRPEAWEWSEEWGGVRARRDQIICTRPS